MSEELIDHATLIAKVDRLKQIIAVCCGLAFGLMGFTGLPAMITFGVVMTVGAFYYSNKVLEYEDEGIRMELITTQAWQAFGLFVLTWTASYNLFI